MSASPDLSEYEVWEEDKKKICILCKAEGKDGGLEVHPVLVWHNSTNNMYCFDHHRYVCKARGKLATTLKRSIRQLSFGK